MLPSSKPIRGVIAVVVIAAAGALVWFFALRDDGSVDGGDGKPERERAARAATSDDPLVRDMSIAEQVDQVLLLGFDGTGSGAPIVEEVTGRQLGAVLVRTPNWPNRGDGVALIDAIEGASKGEAIPPLVVGSQEGGVYRSYADLPPELRELDLGRTGAKDDTRAWATATARAMKSAGFHMNLSPVADIATLDSPLAGRAFSDDPAEVADLTEAALEGCADAEFACAPLHFPGLGAASQDTADGPATVSIDLATLTGRDLLPFTGKEASKAPAMVLSLGLYPEIDSIVPGALTPGIATDLLRGDVGFRGVAISDDLGAGAVQATYSTPKAAVAALGAGIDLIQIGEPADQEGVEKALIDAVESGEIPPERLARAAERVIDLKRDLGLIAPANG